MVFLFNPNLFSPEYKSLSFYHEVVAQKEHKNKLNKYQRST